MEKLEKLIKKIKNSVSPIPHPDDTHFCYFPFFQVVMTADGKYKPCSKYSDQITHKGNILDVSNADINTAWNSDYMVELRRKMRNNEKGPGCSECWREQASGIKPMRYDSFNYNIPYSQVKDPKYPLRVEINASNVCNLKCRICSSFASTKWMAEEKALFGKSEDKHLNLTLDNLNEITVWLPYIEEIGLFGGEPFLSEENLELLRYCVKSGEAKHIRILVNTNTTVYTDEIAMLLKSFKKVYLNFSIDDIGERFEYQRKGADWDNVVENMRKYIEYGGYSDKSQMVCKICCTVTNMNIYYFPEFFDYLNKHFPGLPVFFNLLYNPIEYSVQILPEEVKAAIRERLQTKVKTTFKTDELLTKTVNTLVTYLDYKEEAGDFDEFFTSIERHDKYRNENFATVFPEYWDLIKKYN